MWEWRRRVWDVGSNHSSRAASSYWHRHREAASHRTWLGPVLTRWVWMMLLYSRATRLAHFRASLSRLCSSAEPLSLCSCITFKHTENSWLIPTQHTFCMKKQCEGAFFLGKNHLAFGYKTALHIFSVTDATPVVVFENNVGRKKTLVLFYKTTFMRILWLERKLLVKVMFALSGASVWKLPLSHFTQWWVYKAACCEDTDGVGAGKQRLFHRRRPSATNSPLINKPIRRDEGDDRRIVDQISCHFCWIPVYTFFSSQSLMTCCRLWSSSFHSEDQTFYPVTMIMMHDDLHINSELCKSEAGVSVWDVKSKL